MNNQLPCKIAFAFLILSGMALLQKAGAQVDDVIKIKYGTDTAVQLGVGVDEFEPSQPKQFCLDFETTDLIYDTEGATDAEIVTKATFDMEDFENDFKFDYSSTTTANLSIDKFASSNSSLTNSGKFENFLKNTSKNFVVSIDARADHGSKRVLYNKGLKPEFQTLIDQGRFAEFRSLCGTHFVASHTLRSEISVALDASNISRSLKLTMSNSTNASISASLTIDGLKGGAGTAFTSNVSNVLSLASERGNVESVVRSKGGYGIGEVTAVLSGISFKPDEMHNVYQALAGTGSSFTVTKAAPGEFNLISYSIFGAESPELPADTFRNLEEIFKKLVRVDAIITQYETYQKDRPVAYGKYFKPKHDALKSVRAQILNSYKRCRTEGKCDIPAAVNSDEFPFLTDLYKNAALSAHCIEGHYLNIDDENTDHFLSSIDFVVTGKLNYVSQVDKQSITVSVSEENMDGFKEVDFSPSTRAAVYNVDPDNDTGDILMQIFSIPVSIPDITTPNGFPDLVKIGRIRNSLSEFVFQITTRLKSGEEIVDYFGAADLAECSL